MNLKTIVVLSMIAAVLLCFGTLYVAKTIADAQVRRLEQVQKFEF